MTRARCLLRPGSRGGSGCSGGGELQNFKTSKPPLIATQAARLRKLVQPDRRIVYEFQNSVWVLVEYHSIEGAFGSVETGRAPIPTILFSFARDLLRALSLGLARTTGASPWRLPLDRTALLKQVLSTSLNDQTKTGNHDILET